MAHLESRADGADHVVAKPVLEGIELSKSYGGVLAVQEATLTLHPGRVHSLMGSNGAGKSTLVRMLAGVTQPDAGRVRLEGRVVALSSPRIALRAGIALVPQTLELCPNLTVAENVLLPELQRGLWLSRTDMLEKAYERLAAIFGSGFAASPRARTGSLAFADQQMVAIGRAAADSTRVMILDEPTAMLGRTEAEGLLRSVLSLVRDNALAVLLVSHRLTEVLSVSDEITIMRNGRVVDTVLPSSATTDSLVSMMLGENRRSDSAREPRRAAAEAKRSPALTACLSLPTGAVLDLEVRMGEVVGILGVPGSGRRELIYSLFGASRWATVTKLTVGGRHVPNPSPRALRQLGVGIVPTDRTTEGLFHKLSAHVNAAIGLVTLGPVIRDRGREGRDAAHWLTRLGVVPRRFRRPAGHFSGGNQQKIVMARALAAKSTIILMDEPTIGVDVHTREDLYREIRELANNGLSILVGSSDPEELVAVSDRIVVISAGELGASRRPPFDVEGLLAEAIVQRVHTDPAWVSRLPHGGLPR